MNRGPVLTVGETMALLDPLEDGRPRNGQLLRLRVAGAESNFAVALARLGARVVWVSRLGRDPLGDVVEDTLRAEGVDVRVRRTSRPTGLFYKWREHGRTRTLYYRRGSAACELEPGDVGEDLVGAARIVHLTGITQALSHTARSLVADLAHRARRAGAVVLFDPNFREVLWPSAHAARDAQRDILGVVDWYLCSLEEARRLFGVRDADGALTALQREGVRRAVVRTGQRGAVVCDGSERAEVVPTRTVRVVDEIGAGDGFAAGFAWGLLQGWDHTRCARAGNVVASFALAGTGDWETFPTATQFERALDDTG